MADIEATTEHLKAALPDTFLTTLAYPIKGTPYYAQVESRVFTDGPWETGSDRDLRIAGRHSKRFYRFAVRRMQGEVAIARAAREKPKRLLPLVKAHFNSASGRLGMLYTRREVEDRTGVTGSGRGPSDGTVNPCRSAFDQLAGAYDTEFTNLSTTRKLRRAVWDEMEQVLQAGESVLELGCGTGEDALFLAQRGLRVCACDISSAMVGQAEEKLGSYREQVEFFVADFRTLAGNLPEERQFDAILSDFGGLNCLASLSSFHRLVDRSLRPGGHLFLCLINRFYFRELARGVFRRLRPSGSLVKCGGQRIAVYYHPPRSFRRPDLTVKRIKALAVFGRDDLHSRWPLNRLGDHYLIVLQKSGTDTDRHGRARTYTDRVMRSHA